MTTGLQQEDHSVKVNIPAGARDGVSIRLPGQGDYFSSMSGYAISDAHVKIKVIPDKDLALIDNDVVSSLNISLLDSLKGTSAKVRTVKGEKIIKIPPKVKNLYRMRLDGLGIPGRGDHMVVIGIDYPNDTMIEKIVEVLEQDISTTQESEENKPTNN